MISKVRCSLLICMLTLGTTPLLATNFCWWCNGKAEKKKDLALVKSQIENSNSRVDVLKGEIEELKKQMHALKASFEVSEEYQNVLIKYGDALQNAAQAGDVDVATLLLDKGVDPSTALAKAIRCNQYEIAKTLINYGADVNSVNANKIYLIGQAAFFSSEEIVTLLIENGAQFERVQQGIDGNPLKEGQTPLQWAVLHGNYGAVKALVNGGAHVDGDGSGGTPLDGASQLKYSDNPQNLELIKFLVNNGATRKNKSYKLPCSVISDYLKSVGK